MFLKKHILLWAVVISLVTVGVYARSIGNGFVDYDDGALIIRNQASHGLSLQNITLAFSRYDPELYVPLTFLSYQVDYSIAGLSPWMYHLQSILLHVAASLFILGSAYLLSGKKLWIGVVTGFLFAVHPLQSEAVLWAAGRKDVLAGMFAAASMFFYLLWQDKGGKRLLWLSAGAFLLGLLSKVSIIMLPVGLLLFDVVRRRQLHRQIFLEKIPFFALSILFGIIALFGKGAAGSGLILDKMLIGARAIMLLLTKTFLPFGLSVLYPFTEPISFSTVVLSSSLLIVLGITIAAILVWRRWPILMCGWFFFVLHLLPTFTNFAKGDELLPDVYITSDRYAYVAVFGLFFLAATLLFRVRKQWGMIADGVVAVVMITFAVLTFQHTFVWQNTETLFTHTLRYYPNAHTAYNNLGGVYYRREEFTRAKEAYEKALAIRPSATAHYNLGQLFAKTGDTARAEQEYRKAIELHPSRADAYVNLGVLLLQTNRNAEAVTQFEKAAQLQPDLGLIYFNLGTAYEALGRREQAIAAYRKAVELDPSDTEAAQKMRSL